MNERVRRLELPLDERLARSLTLGQIVTLSGKLFTGRSLFHIRAAERGILPPLDYGDLNCLFHVGPVVQREGDAWHMVSLEPTSSIRFERYAPQVVRMLRTRALVGKTTMGRGTALALKEIGGVHLTKIGLCGNELASQVRVVHGVHFAEELGTTEATWVLEVEAFGPFFVDIDTQGQNYFDALDREAGRRMGAIYRELGIPEDFKLTDVSPQSSCDAAEGVQECDR